MNPRPIHSSRQNLALLAAALARFALAVLGAVLVLVLYIALCWLAYAASYNPQN